MFSVLGLLFSGCAGEAADDGGEADGETGVTTEEALSQTDGTATIRFKNNCPVPIQVGTTIPNDGRHVLPPFARLASGGTFDRNLGPDNRDYPGLAYYGYREGENPGEGNYTLAELHLNSSFHGLDFMDVSLVDAFNVPIRIDGIGKTCSPIAACVHKLNLSCPAEGRIMKGSSVIACSKRQRNVESATSTLARYFNASCPNAYGWSGDSSKDRTCDAQDYRVTFCP